VGPSSAALVKLGGETVWEVMERITGRAMSERQQALVTGLFQVQCWAPEPEPWSVGVEVPWFAWRPGPVYVPVTCTWAPKPVSTVPESTPKPLWRTMQRLLDRDLREGGVWGHLPAHPVVWHDVLMPSWVLYRPVLPRPDTWGC
jgi:hypothetical protein